MPGVATLYIRNVPADVNEGLKQRAEETGSSVNAVVLELLEREMGNHARRRGWFEGLLELRTQIDLSTEAADLAVAGIRAHRDAGRL